MPKRRRKNKRNGFPPLVPLRWAPADRDVYCELCCEPIKVGAPVAWWRVRRWNGRSAVERPTAYCPTCHSANVRAKRALPGECNLAATRGRPAAGEGSASHPTPPPRQNPRRRPRRGVKWGVPATLKEGKQMSEQGPRVRVRDGKGNPIPGLYRRDDRFIAGFQEDGRWRMRTLKATTLTEAKRERASLIVGLSEGRIASADNSTFAEVFEEWQAGRTITERTAEHERYLCDRHLATFKGQKVQKISASEVARVLRWMRDDGLSDGPAPPSTGSRKGVFSLAERRGIVTKNPADGLTDASGRSRRTRRRSSAWTAQRSGS